jgi:hypothetical protein
VRCVGLWTIQDGLDPLKTLEGVEIKYHQYEQCHKLNSTPENINELKKWRNRPSPARGVWLHGANAETLEAMALPKHGTRFATPIIGQAIENLDIERAYRCAVVTQQTAAKQAAKWQADTLPVSDL